MKSSFLIVFSFIAFLQISFGQQIDFNSNCTKAYQHLIALRADSAAFYLGLEKNANPHNGILILLENYKDFLEVYTSGSLLLYEDKKKNFDARLDECKELDANSPYFLYIQAEIHLQAAVLHIKFGEYFATVFDVKKSLKKLEANNESFPNFMPNKKSLGTLYTILGSIPQQYQGSLEFLGLKGNVNQGLDLLKKAAGNTQHPFQHEAATIYSFMLLHIQNDPQLAWQVLQYHHFNPQKNLMDAYSLGHIGIYGLYNDQGIEALLNAPDEGFMSFPIVDFLLGMGKTYRQDSDANLYFKRFLDTNKGDDYIKSAWHKMAWNELIAGNTVKYKEYMNKLGQQGRAVIDTDKQAQKEFEVKETPNANLLKVRLLCDGNYLQRALDLLSKMTVNSFNEEREKTEYFYRLARIYDKKELHQKAIQYYRLTIMNGKGIPYYYAANSAFLLGYLYEDMGEKEAAMKNYTLCLQLNGYEYDNSIHQKAEAALNRLKN